MGVNSKDLDRFTIYIHTPATFHLMVKWWKPQMPNVGE